MHTLKSKDFRPRFFLLYACKLACVISSCFFLVGCCTGNKLTADVTPTTFRRVEVSETMGENPDYDGFILGDACEDCEVTMFPNGTPKYILLTVEGIELCPPWPIPPPNGAWLLTQHPGDPCRWELSEFPYGFQANVGTFWGCIIDDHDTSREYFTDLIGGPCTDLFTNDFTDCLAGPIAINGTARMSWGPSVHP